MSISREIIPVDFDFSGGLNLSPYPEQIQDNEASALTNFDLIDGALVKRPGITLRSNLAGMAPSTYAFLCGQYYFPNSYNLIIVNSSNGKVWKSADGCATFTELLNSVGAASLNVFGPKGEQYANFFFLPTTAGGVWAINAINATQSVGSPNGYFGAIVLDRLFVFNPTTQVVRYTEPGNFNSWPAINTFTVGGAGLDGDTITCMVNYKDRLVIFKKQSIWVLNMTGTPANWNLRKIFSNIGCTGLFAAKIIDDWIYFIDQYGFHRTNLSEIQALSDSLMSAFRTRRSPGTFSQVLDPALNYDTVGSYLGRVIFSITPVGAFGVEAQKIFVFHVDSEAWTQYTPDTSIGTNRLISMLTITDTRAGTVADDTYPKGMYFTGAGSTGFYLLSEENNKTDPTGEYSCILATKKHTFDIAGSLKKITYCVLDGIIGSNIVTELRHNDVVVNTLVAGTTNGTDQSLKLKGPGFIKRVLSKFTFTNPGAGASRDVVIKRIGYGVRIPRPVGVKQVES